jgi:Protein of unknown function (DUF4240)
VHQQQLPADLFWEILAKTHGSPEELQECLSTQDRETLLVFHRSFRKAIDDLWESSVCTIIQDRGDISDDTIRYLFISIISEGKAVYYRTLQNPHLAPLVPNPDAGQLYPVVGRVFWNRFRQEIELPEAEMPPPMLGQPVSVLIPAVTEQASFDQLQRSIMADFDVAGYRGRLVSFSGDHEAGLKFEYLVEDLARFNDLVTAIVGKHLPGHSFEVRPRSG